MISNLVASINAGSTKVAGQSSSSKAKKTKEKVINLDDLKKVQAISKIVDIGKGEIKNKEVHIRPYFNYNLKGEYIAYLKDSHNIDLEA
jgi:hypothetical protein